VAYNVGCLGCPELIPGDGPCKLGGTGWRENPCPKKAKGHANYSLKLVFQLFLATILRGISNLFREKRKR